LLAYLLGPGTAEEHRAPGVIASWDGLDAAWQPASMGPGEYDLADAAGRAAALATTPGSGIPRSGRTRPRSRALPGDRNTSRAM
jgi:hypothetical protein